MASLRPRAKHVDLTAFEVEAKRLFGGADRWGPGDWIDKEIFRRNRSVRLKREATDLTHAAAGKVGMGKLWFALSGLDKSYPDVPTRIASTGTEAQLRTL